MHVEFRRRRTLAPLLACLLAALARAQDAPGDDQPGATPYRPTVSNPADLSAPGWIEVEGGALRVDAEDGPRTDTLPWLVKYAFDENHGLLIGGNAYDRMRGAGQHASGFGDTLVEWKQRLPLREGLALGVEAGVDLPTAPAALGIGKPAYIVNGILSSDLGSAHLDVNVGGTRYTSYPVHASPWQSAWAAAISRPLNEAFGIAFELSGTAQRGADHSHQALAAINYNASRRVVFDAGVAYGLDHTAHDRSLFCGGTFLLGKLR
jgi:hypothetical protein